ncbi:MAG: exo-alpha-sialidase [Verrucomicrobia bacterium]|nr:exo-alpha-sialidase [Verrucomicrobiota bacterium]
MTPTIRTISLLLLVLAPTALGQGFKGAAPALLDARVGSNTRAGTDPAPTPTGDRQGKAEPHLARGAGDPDLLLATYTDVLANGSRISCAVSRDGGLAWTRTALPAFTGANGRVFRPTGNCVAGVGPQGDLYVASLGRYNDTGLGLVVVSRSQDGGANWLGASLAASASARAIVDRPWLAVNDFPGTPNPGRLLVAWADLTFDANGNTTGASLTSAYSDDRGATWSTPAALTPRGSTTEANQGAQIVVLPDGSAIALYTTLTANDVTPLPNGEATINQYRIDCRRSLDGGRTFAATATTAIPTVRAALTPEIVGGGFLISHAAAARQSGDLFASCLATVNGVARVLVAHSSDQGGSWQAATVATDNPAGTAIFNHGIAPSADGRTVAVVYLQRGAGAAGANAVELRGALSLDGGATWQPSLRLSDQAGDLRATVKAQPSNLPLLGDNLGVVPGGTADQPVVAVWCDTRAGYSELQSVRFVPAATGSFDAWRRANFSRTEQADPARSAAAADPDADGVPNLAEYAHATNPRVAESGSAFAFAAGPTTVAVGERVAPGRTDQSATWETSTDGTTWNAAPFDPATTVTAPFVVAIRVTRGRPTLLRNRYALGTASVTTSEVLVVGGDERLVNLATRGQVKTGASQLIVGFVIAEGTMNVLVRGVGPGLAAFGVAGAVLDPRLSVNTGSILVANNDNWGSASLTPAIAAVAARVGAFPLGDGSRDAAVLATLPPGSYTGLIAPATAAGAGVGLAEIYRTDETAGSARLANVATRGEVSGDADTLIAGFVISGTRPRRILIRAVGPTLAQYGLTGVLSDPLLTVFRGSERLAQNDDWQAARFPEAATAAAQTAGAFALAAHSLDSALVLTLPPGAYTAQVSGVAGSAGLALVEVYDAN